MTEQKQDRWNRFRIGADVFAKVAVPVLIAFTGWQINAAIREADREVETKVKMLELAVGILTADLADTTSNSPELRDWAIDIVNKYSEVPISDQLRRDLREKPFILGESTLSMPFQQMQRIE